MQMVGLQSLLQIMSLVFTTLLLLTCPSLKTNQLKPITSAKDHKFKVNGVKMNDACLPTSSLQITSSNFPPPPPFPPGKTFVFRGWQWGICHYIRSDIFYICSKKPELNYTGELLKTALNVIIIYCISNSLQQLITLLNLVFFLILHPEMNSPCNE